MESLIDIVNLRKYFSVDSSMFRSDEGKKVHAVDGVSFSVYKNETLGLVGESGCGKTTLGRCLLRLIEPSDGEILYGGIDLLSLEPRDMKDMRRHMQLVFQDPDSSLNPRFKVKRLVGEPLLLFEKVTKSELEVRVLELLKSVGLEEDHLQRYPHELSGGQKQRVGIARALASGPELLILDEPTSALDVSVQGKILELLIGLQERLKISYLFISHDLSVIRFISDRVAVMYLGRIVELGHTEELFDNPVHPYTKILLSAIPIPDPNLNQKRLKIVGEPPSPVDLPEGCRFQGRCIHVFETCRKVEPELVGCGSGHFVACHLVSDQGE